MSKSTQKYNDYCLYRKLYYQQIDQEIITYPVHPYNKPHDDR